jgi:hypothetical protein
MALKPLHWSSVYTLLYITSRTGWGGGENLLISLAFSIHVMTYWWPAFAQGLTFSTFLTFAAAGSCPTKLKVANFGDEADGVYTQAVELLGGWPYYRRAKVDHCISYDTRFNHWWLQDNCTSLGSNVGLAWLEGQHECPHSCSKTGD